MKEAMPETEKQEYEPKLQSLATLTYCYDEMSKCSFPLSSHLAKTKIRSSFTIKLDK